LARIEAGGVSPNFNTVSKIAAALDLDAYAMLAADGASADVGPRPDGISPREQQLISAFRLLDRDHQDLIVQMAEGFTKVSQALPLPGMETATDRPSAVRTPQHYLQGWDRRTAYDHLEPGSRLGHTAGAQFSKPFEPIRPGDVLWVVFVDSGALHLLGRLLVAGRGEHRKRFSLAGHRDGVIFTQHEAERILGSRDIWPASEHLLAQPGTDEPLRDISVAGHVVRKLRFQTSAGITRAKIAASGAVSGQAFRSVRLLTPESAALLQDIWSHPA
jgi:hypothetical protein